MERFGIFGAIRRHLAERALPPDFEACGAGFEHRDGDPKLIALQNVIHDVVVSDAEPLTPPARPDDDPRVTIR